MPFHNQLQLTLKYFQIWVSPEKPDHMSPYQWWPLASQWQQEHLKHEWQAINIYAVYFGKSVTYSQTSLTPPYQAEFEQVSLHVDVENLD